MSKEQLENIKNYKYATNEWTFMDKKFNPFWDYTVSKLSRRIAPNLLTLLGIVFPVAAFVYSCWTTDFSLSMTLPASACLLSAFGMFWY